MLAKRAKQSWAFLSLDYTGRFFDDLWVPISDVAEFKSSVQSELQSWITEASYHRRGEEMAYALADWYRRTYGQDALDSVLVWMRRIYLFEGPDRLAETVWNIVPRRAASVAAEFPAHEWVFTLMGDIRQHQELRSAEFDQKFAVAESLSAWDEHLLAVQYSDQESLDTKIDLINTYNTFLEAWEKFGAQLDFKQLQEVFEVGRKVIEKKPMSDLEVLFPGSWRFELHDLLSRFT